MKRDALRAEMGTGLAGYQYQLGAVMLAAADELHDDVKFSARIRQMKEVAKPSILRHWKKWQELRDGTNDEPGFWVNEDGKPLESGDLVPKNTWLGMQGAIMTILYDDGVYGMKPKARSESRGAFEEAAKESVWSDDD